MVKTIGKILAIVLVVAVVVAIVAGVQYFVFSVKGTFNVTITEKNVGSLVNSDLPLNTFQAGETIILTIWVSGNTNPFLINTIKLSTYPLSSGLSCSFTDYYSGNSISQGTIPAGNSGFGCYLVITTSATIPQGSYTVTVVGTDNSGITHQDSYSFSIETSASSGSVIIP
jgi:hypothetical protein